MFSERKFEEIKDEKTKSRVWKITTKPAFKAPAEVVEFWDDEKVKAVVANIVRAKDSIENVISTRKHRIRILKKINLEENSRDIFFACAGIEIDKAIESQEKALERDEKDPERLKQLEEVNHELGLFKKVIEKIK